MGARGKGALKQPKDAKNKGGRPRNKGHKPSIIRARKLMSEVFERLKEIVEDPEQERRNHLRAAEILSSIANMEWEEPPDEKAEEEKLVVEFKKEWGKT